MPLGVVKVTALVGTGSGSAEVSSAVEVGPPVVVGVVETSVGGVIVVGPVVPTFVGDEGAPVVVKGDGVASVSPGPVFDGTTGEATIWVVVAGGAVSCGPGWLGPAEQAENRLGANASDETRRYGGRFTSLL